MNKNSIKLRNVSKKYGKNNVLNGISLTVESNAVLGIIGENGAGKTTLLKAILGLVEIDEGKILINEVDNILEKKHYAGKINFLLEPRYHSYLNAIDNLREMLLLYDKYDSNTKVKLEDYLVAFDLQNVKKRKVDKFSFGMKQRLGLAQALITEPNILILDEPFLGLDIQGIKLFKNILNEMASRGCTIILSSHQLDEIEDICTEVVFLKDGKIFINDNIDNLLKKEFVFVFERPIHKIEHPLFEVSNNVCLLDNYKLKIVSNRSDLYEIVASVYSKNRIINVFQNEHGLKACFEEVYKNEKDN